MERLNAINGDSFQPFRPLNCGSAMLLLFLFFFSFSCNFFFFFFAYVCGKFAVVVLLFVYHSWLWATITTQSCQQLSGNVFLTSRATLPPLPRLSVWLCLTFMCVLSPLAWQLCLSSLWPSVKEQGWRIVSSHFVLGEVSDGPWKDGSHLSPRWLWWMVTCLRGGSGGPRPPCTGAEWDAQLPKRTAMRHAPLYFYPNMVANQHKTFN